MADHDTIDPRVEQLLEQILDSATPPKRHAVRAHTYFALSQWLADPALASICDETAVTRLSREEADECLHLWGDVRVLRDRAEKIVDG